MQAQTTTFPFFEKETPSVGKIENLLSQYNCYRSPIYHNLVLLTFVSFGPIYRKFKWPFRTSRQYTLRFDGGRQRHGYDNTHSLGFMPCKNG